MQRRFKKPQRCLMPCQAVSPVTGHRLCIQQCNTERIHKVERAVMYTVDLLHQGHGQFKTRRQCVSCWTGVSREEQTDAKLCVTECLIRNFSKVRFNVYFDLLVNPLCSVLISHLDENGFPLCKTIFLHKASTLMLCEVVFYIRPNSVR